MNDNIISLVSNEGNSKPEVPENDYAIMTIDNDVVTAHGFLVFTSHHIAVMRDVPAGAMPVLVVPLDRVKYTNLIEDETVPF